MSKLAFCISARNLARTMKVHARGTSSLVVWNDGSGYKSLWVPQHDQCTDQSVALDRDMNILMERPCEAPCKTTQDQRLVEVRASERSEKTREACGFSFTRSTAAHDKTGSSFVSKGLALRERTNRGEG